MYSMMTIDRRTFLLISAFDFATPNADRVALPDTAAY